MEYRFIGFADDGKENGRSSDYSWDLKDVPSNPPERREKIEKLVERVVEEHGPALEKLADE